MARPCGKDPASLDKRVETPHDLSRGSVQITRKRCLGISACLDILICDRPLT